MPSEERKSNTETIMDGLKLENKDLRDENIVLKSELKRSKEDYEILSDRYNKVKEEDLKYQEAVIKLRNTIKTIVEYFL
jgi:FtsZ-binding cell division protein ZapB